jgi:hypothetical protein
VPILTYTTTEGPRGGTLNSRVLIGRRLGFGVSFSDPSISRLHAWIDPVADEQAGWVIIDAGSKTGTFVNDQKITHHPLHDGDVIRVGKSSLTYHEQDTLPDGIGQIELIAPPPIVRDSGILFECACGAPLWVGNELAGKRGMCRHCRQPVTVPKLEDENIKPPMVSAEQPAPPPLAASRIKAPAIADDEPIVAQQHRHIEEATASPPAAEPLGSLGSPSAVIVDDSVKRKNKCAVCHSAIVAREEMITCPDCAMTFHAECWRENLGCSSYGCPQVNCLQPHTEPAPIGGQPNETETIEEPAGHSRSEPILLAASVVGSFLGALLFGGLAAVIALASLVVLIRKKPNRSGLLVAAIIVCLFGIAGGLVVSDFYYFNAQHLPAVIARHIHF